MLNVANGWPESKSIFFMKHSLLIVFLFVVVLIFWICTFTTSYWLFFLVMAITLSVPAILLLMKDTRKAKPNTKETLLNVALICSVIVIFFQCYYILVNPATNPKWTNYYSLLIGIGLFVSVLLQKKSRKNGKFINR